MAKRKRLNKRVITVLIAMGGIVAVYLVSLLIKPISAADVTRLVKRGDEALERAEKARRNGNIDDAVAAARSADKCFKKANDATEGKDPEILYKFALAQFQVLRDPRLTDSERGNRWRLVHDLLQRALRIDPSHVESRRQLCQLYWAMLSGVPDGEHARMDRAVKDFLGQADELLKLKEDDHGTYFLRALAKSKMVPVDKDNPEWKKGAIADFDEAIRRKPDSSEYRLGMVRFLREILPGSEQDEKNRLEKEKADLEKEKADLEKKLKEPLPEDDRKRAEANRKLAAERLEGVEADLAHLPKRVYQEAIEANPDKADLRCDYGLYLHKIRENPEALAQIQEVISHQPEFQRLETERAALQTKLQESLAEPERKRAEEALRDVEPEFARLRRNVLLGWITLGQYHESNKDYDEALKALEQAKQVDPSDVRVYGMLAQIDGRLHQLDAAVGRMREGLAVVTKRMEAAPHVADKARLSRARDVLNYLVANLLLEQAQKTREAKPRAALVTEARSLLARLSPGGFEHAKISGKLAFVEDRLTEARSLLQTAMAKFRPRVDLETASLLAQCYASLGQPQKALEVMEKVRNLPRHQDNPFALFSLARLQLFQNEYEQAENLVDSALRVDPEFKAARDLKAVLEVLLEKEDTLPKEVSLTRRQVALLARHAEQLWSRKKRAQAIALLEGLTEKLPNNAALVLRLGGWYDASGHPDKADALVAKAGEYAPALADNLAFIRELRTQKDPEKRFQMRLDRADEKVTDPLRKALAKAAICEGFNKRKETATYLAEAARIGPRDPRVVRAYFNQALRRKDWKLAETWAKVAAEADTDHVKGRMFAAQLAMTRRDFDAAIAILIQVLREVPDSKPVRVLLGKCYLGRREPDRAEETFLSILKLDAANLDAVLGMANVAALQNDRDEHEQWAERAYSLPGGKKNPFVRKLYLQAKERKIREGRAQPRETLQVIRLREQMVAENEKDLDNCFRLAALYDRVERPDRAEVLYKYVLGNSNNKLAAVRPLLSLYAKTDRKSEILKTLSELEATVGDKVGVILVTAETGEAHRLFDRAQAEAAYRNAIEAGPEDPRGHVALARFLERQRDYERATEAMERYLALRPKDVSAERDLIRYEIESRKPELTAKAAEQIKRMLAQNALDVDALALRGLLAFRKGLLNEALRDLDLAVRQAPTAPWPRRIRADVYLVRGERAKAKQELGELRQHSNDISVVVDYARQCLLDKDYATAEIAYKEALRRAGNNPTLLLGLMELHLTQARWGELEKMLEGTRKTLSSNPGYYQIAYRMWRARRDASRALAALKSAVDVAPDAQRPSIMREYLLALLYFKRFDEALALAQGLQGEAGYGSWLPAVQGRALLGMKRTSEADALFLSAFADAKPDEALLILQQMKDGYGVDQAFGKLEEWLRGPLAKNWMAHFLHGAELFRAKKEYARAVPALSKARDLADAPRDKAAVSIELGMAYQQIKSFAEAERAYLDALKELPDSWQVLNNLAYLYATQVNRPEDALAYAKRAYEGQPSNAAVVDTYGWTLATMGHYRDAQAYLAQAAQLNLRDAVYRYHLGFVYQKNDLLRSARRQYQEGLRQAKAAKDADMIEKITKAMKTVDEKLEQEGGE